MSGSSGQIDSSSVRSQSDTLAAASALKGRVAKKKGLSRHYPHKAQSFDCIASLAASAEAQSGALVLSKSLSKRRAPASGRQASCAASLSAADNRLSAMRRVTSSITIQECPMEESWCSDETELCCAMQLQASLRQPEVAQTCEPERQGSDATSSCDSVTA